MENHNGIPKARKERKPLSTKSRIKLGLAGAASLLIIGGGAGSVLTHDTFDKWDKQRALNKAKTQETTALMSVQTDNEQLVNSIEATDGGAVVKGLRVNLDKDTVTFTDNAGQGGAERDCTGRMEKQNSVAQFSGKCVTVTGFTTQKK